MISDPVCLFHRLPHRTSGLQCGLSGIRNRSLYILERTGDGFQNTGGAPVTVKALPGDYPGMTRARILIVVVTVGLALFLSGGVAAASPGGPDPYLWIGPQVRPWLEPIFVGLANWFFNLPLVPYLS